MPDEGSGPEKRLENGKDSISFYFAPDFKFTAKNRGIFMKRPLIEIDADRIKGNVSDTLFGLFWEDINYSCDGGLNANMVRNYSFDEVYLDDRRGNDICFVTGIIKSHEPLKKEKKPLRFWNCTEGALTAGTEKPVSENSVYGRVTVEGKARLENGGYGSRHYKNCAMPVLPGVDYTLSLYIRGGYEGSAKVCVRDMEDLDLTDSAEIPVTGCWKREEVHLKGKNKGLGKLVFDFDGRGSVDLDAVMFYKSDYWGSDNPKWSQGKLRRDLVEAIKELRPKFMRFPGGCVVEGIDIGNEYHWKDSVGELTERKPDYNLWAYREKDCGYSQSRQIGFYEFFLLCEDLNMEPLPVVWAGMNCQIRKRGAVPADSEAFERDVIQNALDLIEYAKGDPEKSHWAKLRAEAGHPEPFSMKYIGIGNENYGEDYLKRFRRIKDAIDKKYPGITCILSCGGYPEGKDFELSWRETEKGLSDVYVDEHFYRKPSWLISGVNRYDGYDRRGAKVFLGEWAAFDVVSGTVRKNYPVNTFGSALSEAAFLTGVEKNADVVAMTCYAPLFAKADANHWKHNLIWFNQFHVLKTPNYYVQQMFGATVGKRILDIGGDVPDGIFVSATGGDGYICLKVVNTLPKDRNIELSLKGFKAARVKKITLSSDDLKERNTITFRGEPEERVKPQEENVDVSKINELFLKGKSVSVYQIFESGS